MNFLKTFGLAFLFPFSLAPGAAAAQQKSGDAAKFRFDAKKIEVGTVYHLFFHFLLRLKLFRFYYFGCGFGRDFRGSFSFRIAV